MIPQLQIVLVERGTGSGSWIVSVETIEEKVLLIDIATFKGFKSSESTCTWPVFCVLFTVS